MCYELKNNNKKQKLIVNKVALYFDKNQEEYEETKLNL